MNLGSLAVGKEPHVRRYLGLAEIPQASVAIGLAVLGSRALGGEVGATLETVVVAAGVLYEIVGPVVAKLALYLSGSYTDRLEELLPDAEGGDEVAVLSERIRKIREGLPSRSPEEAEEDAFTEAALEQRDMMLRRRGPWRNR